MGWMIPIATTVAGAMMSDSGDGGGDTTTSSQDLPDWLKPYYERSLQRQEASQLKAGDIAGGMEGWAPEGWSAEEEAAMGMLSELPSSISGMEHAGTGFLGAGTDVLDQLSGMTGGMTDEQRQKFMDPYTESVIGNTIRDMEEQSRREQMAGEARAAQIGGTGGSRQAVADLLREKQLGRETADYADKARSDAFRWGTETGMQDLQEQFGRGQGLTESMGRYSELADKLATTKSTRDMAMADMMSGMGKTKRQGFNAQDMWPMELQDWYQGQVGGGIAGPTGVTQGSTTTPSEGNMFSSLLGAGLSAYGAYGGDGGGSGDDLISGAGGNDEIYSDERLKDDFGDAPGLSELRQIDPMSYRYHGDEDRTAGFIAQDVEQVIPDAVHTDRETGFKKISLAPIMATMTNAIKELDERTRQPVAQGGL